MAAILLPKAPIVMSDVLLSHLGDQRPSGVVLGSEIGSIGLTLERKLIDIWMNKFSSITW